MFCSVGGGCAVKVAICQPTYLPWSGYFDLIDQVDLFIALDNVQFAKRSWQQRNQIRTPKGLEWITVPVLSRARFDQFISEVEISDPKFAHSHLRSIEHAYRRSAYFAEFFPQLQQTMHGMHGTSLLETNLGLVRFLLQQLDIATPILKASSLGQSGKRSELLANLCSAVGATEYLSPKGSAAYLLQEHSLLTARGIAVSFQHYEHPEYRQVFTPFQPFASVIDLIFNEGKRAPEILRSGRRSCWSVDGLAQEIQLGSLREASDAAASPTYGP